ncbi:peptidase U32 [Chlorobaculum parvum NCIB 8327]|uniref:Peptidase U32 n=1 Tax=Chlorobaculum parvum (strain DSM 263 / NCIMB 8327) TaxID=517417 RepID=B3QKV7_CHLP8|nr:peptidase U32 family protein [Chlorobaculum parvum]ACF10745.1 peptidase U32 [Chlorobaculum parvum NCIB 8327]
MPVTKPELISPAGDWTSMRAALDAGANAVYFGAEGFNMRAASKGFAPGDFGGIARLCRSHGAKAYLALNSVIYDAELGEVDRTVATAKAAGLDAVICWDLAVVEACRRHAMPIHLSTQASVSNISALRFYASLGARMIVLARELTLEQTAAITKCIAAEKLPVTVESFVHGAMCVAVSGRCFLSQELFGRSANRGECVQPCRRSYRIADVEEGFELELGSDYVMSPKDLCTLPFLDKLFDAGIGAFKIEGRNRSPEYVATTTAAYRKAIDFIAEHRDDENFDEAYRTLTDGLQDDLARVYNRGFSEGFFFGKPADAWTKHSGSVATETKSYVGVVRKYFPKAGVAEILVHAPSVDSGVTLSIQGSATGLVTVPDAELHLDGDPANRIGQGQVFTVRCNRVRKNDKVYVLLKK